MSPEVAESIWRRIYEESDNKCSHKVRLGRCSRSNCDVGLRKRQYHILSGSILHFWSKMENEIQEINKLQIVRLNITEKSMRIIGILIPERAVKKVLDILRGPVAPSIRSGPGSEVTTSGGLKSEPTTSGGCMTTSASSSSASTLLLSTPTISSMTKSFGTSLLKKKEDAN